MGAQRGQPKIDIQNNSDSSRTRSKYIDQAFKNTKNELKINFGSRGEHYQFVTQAHHPPPSPLRQTQFLHWANDCDERVDRIFDSDLRMTFKIAVG